MPLVTRAEYARLKGWSKPYITKLVQKGRIEVVGGKIDTDKADLALAGNTSPQQSVVDPESKTTAKKTAPAAATNRPAKPKQQPNQHPKHVPQTGAGDPAKPKTTYVDARTDRELIRAQHAKLDYEKAAGRLIQIEQAEQDGFTAGRLTRDAVLAVPDRLAATLAAESDSKQIREDLYQALAGALRLATHAR